MQAGKEKEETKKIACLIEGMKKDSKPGSFVKIQKVPQGADENPGLFQGRLVAAISKIYKSRPNIAWGKNYIKHVFYIYQSSPDIHRK